MSAPPQPHHATILDGIYDITTTEARQHCCNAFATAVQGEYPFLSKKSDKAAVDAVLASKDDIAPELYRAYADNLRRAIDAVPLDNDDLQTQWHANVSRFAAYKAHTATQRIREANEEYGREQADRLFRIFNRYQAAEYNTAVARARTGKQWDTFMGDDNRRLFPSIQWLPSRSANPREEHMPFYYKIWAKDDPFWTTNFPGNLWNCKCDWEETDDDPTDDNPQGPAARPGLDLNPAMSGQIFTDTNLYVAKAPAGTERKVNEFGRYYVRQQNKNTVLSAKTEIGTVEASKKFFNEAPQASIDKKGYWIKNEVLKRIDEYLPTFDYAGAESIDLSHNKIGTKTYKLKAKATKMHVFKQNAFGYDFTCKVLEMQDGTLLAYTLTVE